MAVLPAILRDRDLTPKLCLMSKKPVRNAAFTAGGDAFSDLNVETFRLNGRLLMAGDRLTEGLGLTSARWQVMGTLRSAGQNTVSHIARNMGLQRQSVQRTVDLLEQEGLVKLVNNPRHRRARLVALTPKGWTVIRKVVRLQAKWANEIADGIDAREIAAAAATMRKLRARLGGRN
jgi:DNA-binding MarR family transcriptional regulator